MNKMVICKNCGAGFDDSLDKCPYCHTMHKKGAYKKFRQKIADIIDRVLGLKIEAERSLSQIILFSIARGLLISAVCIGLAFILSQFRNVNYYNDRPYDEKRLEDIVWENDNIAELEKAYFNNDFDTVEKLYLQNSRVVHNWQHYSSYILKKQYKSIMEDKTINEYVLRDSLYYIYYPDYYARVNTMSEEELVEYNNLRESLIKHLVANGYSESELQIIYDKNKDSYGYLRSDEIRKYVKGADNG